MVFSQIIPLLVVVLRQVFRLWENSLPLVASQLMVTLVVHVMGSSCMQWSHPLKVCPLVRDPSNRLIYNRKVFRLVICQLVEIGKIFIVCLEFCEVILRAAGARVDSGSFFFLPSFCPGAFPIFSVNCSSWERPVLVIWWTSAVGKFSYLVRVAVVRSWIASLVYSS